MVGGIEKQQQLFFVEKLLQPHQQRRNDLTTGCEWRERFVNQVAYGIIRFRIQESGRPKPVEQSRLAVFQLFMRFPLIQQADLFVALLERERRLQGDGTPFGIIGPRRNGRQHL